MKGLLIAMLAVGGVLMPSLPGLAQGGRSGDPNLGHFYMARQQWQILDDAPQVYDKRSDPAAVNQQSGIPRGPAPLPRAGFMPYSSSMPSGMGAGLPQVVNGVPPKPTQRQAVSVAPRTAKAGKYKAMKAASSRPAGPVTAKTYAPYNGYGGGSGSSMSSGGSSSGNGTYGQSVSSSTGVKGSLLHWSRTRSGY